jgi:septal ring factor EnvC (AmiA/AmiB activator)
MKKTPALIAAFVMTLIVGLGMLLVGSNALFNPSSVALASSSNTPDATVNPNSTDQLQQLQSLVAQYQSREQQYQQQLNQLQQQVTQSNTQVKQYQQLVTELQRRGIIQINQNGQIQLPRGFTSNGD